MMMMTEAHFFHDAVNKWWKQKKSVEILYIVLSKNK